jgi:fatty acid desaturase
LASAHLNHRGAGKKTQPVPNREAMIACAPMNIVLSDPAYSELEVPRKRDRLALNFIHDIRDVPFLGNMAVLTLFVVIPGVALFVPGVFRWWLGAVHIALVLFFLGPFILMLHNTSHRRFFKAPYARLNMIIPWIIGPFFGETPETYFAHHVGMHHPENNLKDDISSTLPYRRDSFIDFMRYFLRFFFGVIVELPMYFSKKKRPKLIVMSLGGELVFWAAISPLLFLNWRAAVMVFVLPLVLTRFLMMAGNWGQHAFVDRDAPENCYRNSITCINTIYNRRCFNDGYHIGHHVKQTRHWTEMPEDFRSNIATYAKEKAIVFSGIDFFQVWAFLMLKRYDWLEARMVQLSAEKASPEESIAMMKSRTEWVLSDPAS